jgi:hypothetical protein
MLNKDKKQHKLTCYVIDDRRAHGARGRLIENKIQLMFSALTGH